MTPFSRLAETFAELERTSSRLAMVRTLAELFRALGPDEIQPAIYLLQGRLGPSYDAPEFGINERLTTRALALFTGHDPTEIERQYREVGDHGVLAERLLKRHRKGGGLSVADVYAGLRAVAEASGEGSVEKKIQTLVRLLERATPLEAKYLLRIPMGRLRLGVGDA
ncbi:MAG TPA: hypothetical protein VNI83_05470, partial [Vicinamibacterales bacterium]|nr:hypothetical protein [Vicinamibacterales bacterium]